jgi:hypothetical protein
MKWLSFLVLGAIVLSPCFGDELEITIGGKAYKAKPIPDLVSILNLEIKDPPADASEKEIRFDQNKLPFEPFVACEFTSKGKVVKRVSLAIHPDDKAQAEKDFANPKDPVYSYRVLVREDGKLYSGDEKKVALRYFEDPAPPVPNDPDDITIPVRPQPPERKILRLTAALYFKDTFKWWMRVEGDEPFGYLVTQKPNRFGEALASKVKCQMGGKTQLTIAP